MTSSSYFLERDGLGSGRRVIDVNSNATLLPSASHLTYRSSYGTTSPLPYTSSPHLGYGSSSSAMETSDAKKMLAEVRTRPSESQRSTLLFRLVTRSNATVEKRHGEERRIDSRTVIDQVWLSKKVFRQHRSVFSLPETPRRSTGLSRSNTSRCLRTNAPLWTRPDVNSINAERSSKALVSK